MPKYNILLYGTVTASVEVEANNYDEAVEQAVKNAPQTSFAIAKFNPVEEWVAEDSYQRDGEWIDEGDPTYGD